MKGRLDKRIQIQILNDNEEWVDYYSCFANVNVASGKEYFGSGVQQSASNTIFEIRYSKALENLYLNTQIYRIKFRNGIYDIQAVDNYMFQNETLKIMAIGKMEV